MINHGYAVTFLGWTKANIYFFVNGYSIFKESRLEVFMKGKLTFTSKQITGIAVLLALVIVLQAGVGTVSIGLVQLNFALIPIVLGAIIYGPLGGGFLGFACGVVVLIQVIMGMFPFYVVIWTYTPVVASLTCLVKTTVAGFLCGILHRAVKKKNETLATCIAAIVVPMVNTGLFIIGCFFMNESIVAYQSILGALPEYMHVLNMNPFVFIMVILVSFNFFFELAVNLILAPTLKKVLKYIKI
jgi:uncharacterized membrane protein